MAVSVGSQPQVSSYETQFRVITNAHTAGVGSKTVVQTLKKLTPNGTDGSVTEVDGKITAYTLPT
jgi:hypothetical protein